MQQHLNHLICAVRNPGQNGQNTKENTTMQTATVRPSSIETIRSPMARILGGAAAILALLCLIGVTQAALVNITGTEIWNGTSNPHASDGVTVSGAGTLADPYVYTIPDGITMSNTGLMTFYDGVTTAPYVSFDFSGSSAGFQIDSGGKIDTVVGARTSRTLGLNLGTNSITGSGSTWSSAPANGAMGINIQGGAGAAVTLNSIDSSDQDASLASVTIQTGGAVQLGSVNVSEIAGGGGSAGNILIRGTSINVTNGLSAYSARNISIVPNMDNGNITLEALAYPGFDPNDDENNTWDNLITLGGRLDVEGSAFDQGGGTVIIRGVRVTLASDFVLDQEVDSLFELHTGAPLLGTTFIDNSGGGFTATEDVLYKIPEPSTAILLLAGGVLCLRRRRR